MNFLAGEIAKVCNGVLLTQTEDVQVEKFSIDTRNMQDGDMYVALNGENFNGNEYLEDALKKGAIGAIVDENPSEETINNYKDRIIVKVQNALTAIQELAAYKRSLYDIPVIAVTGSVGKTSTKDIIASILSEKFNVLKTEANYNNHIGLPLTLLKLKDHNAVVLEMGMNHFGEISLLSKIAKPTMAVITNVGTSHIGNLGSRDNILKAKLEILEGLSNKGKIIVNNDNDLLNKWANNGENKYNVVTYGIENKSDYMAYNISIGDYTKYEISIDNKEQEIMIPVIGNHFIYNSLCAIAVAKQLDIDIEKVKIGMKKLKLTSKRMDFQQISNGATVLVDYYNASYDSIKAALEAINIYRSKRKIAVLGDMLELGKFSQKLHKKVGEEVYKNKIDILITVGKLSKNIAEEAKKLGTGEVYICLNNNEAVKILENKIKKGDIILLKASNRMNFEEIFEKIK